MKNLDQMFVEAVGQLLKELKVNDDGTTQTSQNPENTKKSGRLNAAQQIIWKPGRGRWSDVIRGLKEDADVTYSTVISRSSASGSKSVVLMGKLGVTKKASSKNSLAAAAQILTQAVSSPVMSTLYGTPKVTENAVIVPVKISMNDEDVRSGEGISGRNATVFIHLTLLGAYNSRMFSPSSVLILQTASPESRQIIIRKVPGSSSEDSQTV